MRRYLVMVLMVLAGAMSACVTEPEQPAQSSWEDAFAGDWVDGARGGRSPDQPHE